MSSDAKPSPQPWKVCQRVADLRKQAGLSQSDLADLSRLTRSQVANIETGRTNLQFRPGWNICKALDINQWFMATGKAPQRPFHNFNPDEVTGYRIKDAADFGRVCDKELADELQRRNQLLTSIHASVKSEPVKPLWPLLKERLQRATAEPGTKTRLADYLGVKIASVSQWLTDSKTSAREPGAETALRMLKWVELQERK